MILQDEVLKPVDVLIAQRASRHFRNTIQGSITLRRKIFIEPDWTLVGKVFDAHKPGNIQGKGPRTNNILLRAFPGSFPSTTLMIHNDGASAGGQASDKREEWAWLVCLAYPAYLRHPPLAPKLAHPEASWRKMFLAQPPCREMYLAQRHKRGGKPAINCKGGVTMGDFIDEVTKDRPSCEGRRWPKDFVG